MLKLKLRDVANYTHSRILTWLVKREAVELTDDSGEKRITDTYNLMLTWYGLAIHRNYNDQPYLLDEVIKTQVYNDDAFQTPINNFLERIMLRMDNLEEIDFIKRLIFIWKIQLNNFITILGQSGVIAATAECVVEVNKDPGIVEIKRQVLAGEITIDEGEIEFDHYIRTAPSLDDNMFALMCRTNGVTTNQGYQTEIIRGHVFDITNRIFPNYIADSYVEGVTNLADSIADRCSAGKALITNGKTLEDSEWFHRKIHIAANVIKGIDPLIDCGTSNYMSVKIKSKNHLSSLQGKYLIKEDMSMMPLTKSALKTLKVGEVVNLRSVYGCDLLSTGRACKTCLGLMKSVFPYNAITQVTANIGMFSGSNLLERVSQRMLGIKHFLRNSVTIPFSVNDKLDAEVISTDGDHIFFQKDICVEGSKLMLPSSMNSELSDLKNLDSLEELNEDQLRTFVNITIINKVEDPMTNGTAEIQRTVTTSVSTRSARMTKDLIEYIVENSWEEYDKKHIVVDLSNFNSDSPAFFLPYIHEDLDVYRKMIESFLTFKGRNTKWMEREVTPEIFGEVLTEFWVIVEKKFGGFNILHLEIILASLLTRDPKNLNFRLPNGNEPKYFTPFTKCINSRGIGALLSYQGQNNVIESPECYLVKERQSTVMDGFFHPILSA